MASRCYSLNLVVVGVVAVVLVVVTVVEVVVMMVAVVEVRRLVDDRIEFVVRDRLSVNDRNQPSLIIVVVFTTFVES